MQVLRVVALACAAGAGGADLGARLEHIMLGVPGRDVGGAKRLLLGTAMLASLALPLAMGFVAAPLAVAVKRVVAVQAQMAVQAQTAISAGMMAVAQQIGAAPVAHVEMRRLPHIRVARAMPTETIAPQPPAPAPVVEAQPMQAADAAPVVQKAEPPPVQVATQAVLALDPRGEGDPAAVTCRVPQILPGTRLPGPTVCKVNRLWAELRVNHAVISPDGREVEVTSDRERRHSLSGMNCDMTRAAGGATLSITGMPLKFCL